MLVANLRGILKDKLLLVALITLLIGQLLYLVGFGWIYAFGLIFVLATGLPFPVILRGLLSRFAIAIVLGFSFIQLAAIAQFFIWPQSDFRTLSVVTSVLVILTVLCLYRFKTPAKPFSSTDIGALLTAAFFAVPMSLIVFWAGQPLSLVAFGARQSQDGSAHHVALSELGGAKHFTYNTNPTYYPKGFHIAEALFLDTFNLHQREQSWLTNARTFVVQYLIWGSLLAVTLYIVGRWLMGKFIKSITIKGELLLACIIGPSLSLFYLIPFAHQGFLNFYYICAAFVVGLLFLPGFKLQKPGHQWFVLAFFMLAFGATLSWGPILLPVVAAIPVFYVLAYQPNTKRLLAEIFSKKYLSLWAGAALLLIPLYIHFKYSPTETAFNAYGSIRDFNYAVLLAGLAISGFLLFAKTSASLKNFAANVLLPAFLLVGGLVATQYFTAGEVRYYAIKTSYLLEIILLVCGGVVLYFALQKLSKLQQWLVGPVIFGIFIFMLIAANANPLQSLRNMFATPNHFETDIAKVTELGLKGELKVANNTVLHFVPGEHKIMGNPLIPNWANALATVNEGNPISASCSSKIFTTFAYGSGSAQEQKELVDAIKVCINDRAKQGKPYYIITDPDSQPHLKKLLGELPIFL